MYVLNFGGHFPPIVREVGSFVIFISFGDENRAEFSTPAPNSEMVDQNLRTLLSDTFLFLLSVTQFF